MSTTIAEIIKIDRIEKHPNADRLDLAHFQGYQIVVGRDEFKPNDHAIYIPIDSILPVELEQKIFGDAKVKLSNHRVKTIKLRGAISQGLLITNELAKVYGPVGTDVTAKLGITKYEPPVKGSPQGGLRQASQKQVNPNFHKYTDIENFQRHSRLFREGDKVWITEKIHGTNFRAGWVKSYPRTFWQRLRQRFGWFPEYEFVYGSHNVQLQDGGKKNFYKQVVGKNVYWEAVEKYDLMEKLMPGVVAYGEIYGDGIQPNFAYGCKPNERKLAIFDIKFDGIYASHRKVVNYCRENDLPAVPVDAVGEYADGILQLLANMPSRLVEGHVREGVVIKPEIETVDYLGRKILKYKSPEFLLKFEDNTH